MLLKELLNSKINYISKEDEQGYLYYVAKIGNQEILVTINSTDPYQAGMDRNAKVVMVEFGENPGEGNQIDFDLTGKGNEFEIFAMVKDCMMIYAGKYHPDAFIFAADKKDKGRSALYEKLVKRNLPSGYSLDKHDDPDDALVIFIIKKNKD